MTSRPQLPNFFAIIFVLSAFSTQVSAAAETTPTQTTKETSRLGSAVEWIPADAAFYRSAMRNREQIETVLNSRAWAKLCELPICREYARLKSHPLTQVALQVGKSKLTEAQPGAAQMETILNDPQVQRLLEFLVDICSDEVFVYGDRGFIDLVDLAHEVNLAAMRGSLGKQQCVCDLMLETLAKNTDRIAVPNAVMGFRIRDRHLASEQLGKLELVLGLACWTQPQLQGRMRRERIDGTSYLTFKLDGRLLSGPQAGIKLEQLEKGETAALRKKIEAMQVTIALGIKGDYLLLSVGPTTEGLAKLNVPDKQKVSERLIDRVEMKPVARMSGQRLTSVCYRSRELNEALCGRGRYAAFLAEVTDARLSSSQLDAETKARLRHDAAVLHKDIESLRKKPGAVVAICLMSERGVESYCFDRAEHPWLAGYKPLDLLDHVGGRPLLLKSYRTTITDAQYDMAVRWLATAYGYFEDHVLWNIDAAWRKRCRLTVALVKPVLRQADRVNRRVLLPALRDGQVVFVLNNDGPALVADTTAAERIGEAFEEYNSFFHDINDALMDVRDSGPHDFNAPQPRVSQCPWPAVLGLPQVSGPNMGRVGRVVILTGSADAARRLLKPTPPALGNLPAKAEHPPRHGGIHRHGRPGRAGPTGR